MKKKPKILLVDDDNNLRRVLSYTIETAGFEVIGAESGEDALKLFSIQQFDVVITDVQMSGISGIELLRKLKNTDPDVIVIVITAFGTIEMAVEAMKEGAFHYISKPFNKDELIFTLEKGLSFKKLERENKELKKELLGEFDFGRIITVSDKMKKIFEVVKKVSSYDANVFITGESGTGKELVARAVHFNSPRSRKEFITVNCAAIPETLLESELFGHTKGAFTGAVKDKKGKFELAEGGSIFLDEIGDIPLELQVKLLRVIQEKEINPLGSEKTIHVDIRVISATNVDIEEKVKNGAFREDLFYRLNVIPVHVPPLRERKEDIIPLVNHFLKKHSHEIIFKFAPEAMKVLIGYNWPGNVRELENIIERTVILSRHNPIPVDELPDKIRLPYSYTEASFEFKLPEEGLPLEDFEKYIILKALEKNGYNQSKTAKFLNIPRHVLLYRLEKFGIDKGVKI